MNYVILRIINDQNVEYGNHIYHIIQIEKDST